MPVIRQDVLEGLFDTAMKFRKLEPWVFMGDSEVFGAQNPDTGEIAYCCVMGTMGQVLGLVAYRGTTGFEFWRKMQDGEISPESPGLMFMQDCLLVTFEPKGRLDPQDKKLIARLGLKFTGKRAYPQFRSHRPGLMPWYLNESDAKFMALILGVASMDLIPRLMGMDKRPLPEPEGDNENQVLAYLSKRKADHVDLELGWITPPPVVAEPAPAVALDELQIRRIKQLQPKKSEAWEADWFFLPSTIHDREVPYFAKLALIADKKSGYIFNVETLPFEQGPGEGVVTSLLTAIEKSKLMPAEVRVRSAENEAALKLVASKLGFAVVRKKSLPAIDEAREALVAESMSGFGADDADLF